MTPTRAMAFRDRYPVPLSELLVTPVIFRESLPMLADLPFVSGAAMRDLAEFGGYSAGAIRTAMSRLRSSGVVEVFTDERGVARYRMTALQRSVTRVVQGRFARPQGFLLAVFSFASDDARERHVVREALKYHGFQRLAQNVYVNGQIDTAELEGVLREHGLLENVYLFRCSEIDDPALRRKLTALFDVSGRREVLSRFHEDLTAYLGERGLSDDELARRYFYAGPVHYRISFIEEPPLPARYLPADYPLDRLVTLMTEVAEARSGALVQYYRRMNS